MAKYLKKRKAPVGSIAFYLFLLALIVVGLLIFTIIRVTMLRPWLVSFEATNPKYARDEVMSTYFTALDGERPDFAALYDVTGQNDTMYETKENFVSFMEAKTAGQPIVCYATSAGLTGGKKYIVRAGEETLATFTLKEVPGADPNTTTWALDSLELFYERNATVTVKAASDHKVVINGVELGEDAMIQTTQTMAERYLPEGVHGKRTTLWRVEGLLQSPQVQVLDENGNAVDVTAGENGDYFEETALTDELNDDIRNLAKKTAEVYSRYMINAANSNDLRLYFDSSSQTYNSIRSSETWMQNYKSYVFANEEVSEYCRYAEDYFSVRVSLSLNVTRMDDSVKEYTLDTTFFFQGTTNRLAYNMTNVDVQKETVSSRLVFKDGDNTLTSIFVSSEDHSFATPVIPAPEGKVFVGWAREEVDENGQTVLAVIFQPDESGNVNLATGFTLEPMTLYAAFDDAPDAPEATE